MVDPKSGEPAYDPPGTADDERRVREIYLSEIRGRLLNLYDRTRGRLEFVDHAFRERLHAARTADDLWGIAADITGRIVWQLDPSRRPPRTSIVPGKFSRREEMEGDQHSYVTRWEETRSGQDAVVTPETVRLKAGFPAAAASGAFATAYGTVTPGPIAAAQTVTELKPLVADGMAIQGTAPRPGEPADAEHMVNYEAWISRVQKALERWPEHRDRLRPRLQEGERLWDATVIERQHNAIQSVINALKHEHGIAE